MPSIFFSPSMTLTSRARIFPLTRVNEAAEGGVRGEKGRLKRPSPLLGCSCMLQMASLRISAGRAAASIHNCLTYSQNKFFGKSKISPKFCAPQGQGLLRERGRPDRRGARLAPHSFPHSFLWILSRIGRALIDGGPASVWRDAKHSARDARAPRNRPCPIRIADKSSNHTPVFTAGFAAFRQFLQPVAGRRFQVGR